MIPALRRLWFGALVSLLLPAAAHAASLACPGGQRPMCVGVCFCVQGGGEIEAAYERMNQIAAAGLESWIRQSHDRLAAGELRPIPLPIRLQLEPYFSFAVLDGARYVVGDAQSLDAANTLLRNPDIVAVTLDDIVVFRRQADALDNPALWAHELTHVEQYQAWGIAEFARRYTRDYRSVEAPAYALEVKLEQALADSGAAR